MGSKVSVANPSKSDRIWQSFGSLGNGGLSKHINRWHSCELDALDTRLMEVCKYEKKKYLNFPLFLQFFPNLHRLRQTVQRMYFDFFDVTNSTYIAPKQLVACLSVIMFVSKVDFGKEVLSKVFSHSDPDYYSDSEYQLFVALNEEFRFHDLPKIDNKDKRKFISVKDFSNLVATHYDVIQFVRLFDFYETKIEMEQVDKVRTLNKQVDIWKETGKKKMQADDQVSQVEEPERLRIRMVKGTVVYVVSMEWFLVWVRYLQIYNINEVIFYDDTKIRQKKDDSERKGMRRATDQASEVEIEEHRFSEDSITQQQNQHWITRPSKINNLWLLDEYEEDLRPDLQLYRDVIPLPEGLWKMLQEVYGGGPEIRRVYPELYPMILYRVLVDSGCNFKSNIRRKMHNESSVIEKVLDQDERGNERQAHIFLKKYSDPEWTDYPWHKELTNRNMHHGYVVMVPNEDCNDFIRRYCENHESNLHYGSRLKIKNLLGEDDDGYIFSINGGTYTIHYPGYNYRCDTEFSSAQLEKALADSKYIPKPKHVFYGLPSIVDKTLQFIPAVLECLLSTPYFKWYLERKKYNDALAPQYANNSLVKQFSQIAEEYKRRQTKPDIKVNVEKFTKSFLDRMPSYKEPLKDNRVIFPNEFLSDLLALMADELSIPQYILETGNLKYEGTASNSAEESVSIIPKFFASTEVAKTGCDDCKSEQRKELTSYIISLPVCEDELVFYEAIFRSKKGEFKKYGIRIKKSEKFIAYAQRFSEKIGAPMSRLAIAEIYHMEFRKHYGENDYQSTLQLLGLQETDIIYIFEVPEDAVFGEQRANFNRVISNNMNVIVGSYVDFNVYSDWQVGRVERTQRDKALIVSHDGQTEVEYRRIRMFKEKTKEKSLFRIDVMHRKWSSTSHKVEYFLIPSVIAVGEWMTWRDVLLLIDREASNFKRAYEETEAHQMVRIDEEESAQEQQRSKTGSRVGTRNVRHDNTFGTLTHRKPNASNMDNYATVQSFRNPSTSDVNMQPTNPERSHDHDHPRPNSRFGSMVKNSSPFDIHIMLKNYGETCYNCKKKIQIISENRINNSEKEKYCTGKDCDLPMDVPIGIKLDLRKVCFTVDWSRDFDYALPANLAEDGDYAKEKKLVEQFKNELTDSLKVYSESGIKVDIRCPKCQYTQGLLRRNIDKTPNILIIHLNRFKRTKDDYLRYHNKINFNEKLSLSSITLNSDRINDSYQLYGLIGLKNNDLVEQKWYSAFTKNKGYWVRCEGGTALPVDIRQIKTQQLYMLFYRKVNVEGTLITNVI